MAKGFSQAILAVWMSLLCHAVASQQPVSQPPAQEPRQLAEAAIVRYEASETSKTRFTNFKLIHMLNFNEKEKKTYEVLELFEETWINDLPYERLIEHNGKPLEGKQLRQEQERIMAHEKRVTIDGEGTFTRYRRFTTQVTLGPASVIPKDSPLPQ